MGWVGAASAAGPVGTLRGELLLQCRTATAAALFAAPVAGRRRVYRLGAHRVVDARVHGARTRSVGIAGLTFRGGKQGTCLSRLAAVSRGHAEAASARAPPIMRSGQLAIVALSTFALTRWLDTFVLSGRPVQREPAQADLLAGARRQIAEPADEPAPVAVPTRPAAVSAAAATAAASAVAPAAVAPKEAYFIMIGFPIGIDKRNYDRRQLLRAMWYPEYANLGKTVRSEFVVGLLTYQGDG